MYYQNGVCHRLDGSAVWWGPETQHCGKEYWWVNGVMCEPGEEYDAAVRAYKTSKRIDYLQVEALPNLTNIHIGSCFDEFLHEEGMYDEVTVSALCNILDVLSNKLFDYLLFIDNACF